MHSAVGDADIDLSGQLEIPGFDAGKIPAAVLWRGWFNAADASKFGRLAARPRLYPAPAACGAVRGP